MKRRATLPLLLGISALVFALVACSAAPASQNVEEGILAPAAPKIAEPVEQPAAQTPEAAKLFQADSVAPKAVEAVNREPAEESVEVGYKVGMLAPEFGMSLLDGSRVTDASIADEGKPVFIFFHATY